MKKEFGKLADGRQTYLYILKNGGLEAQISDFGATLQRLYVPDAAGKAEDFRSAALMPRFMRCVCVSVRQ